MKAILLAFILYPIIIQAQDLEDYQINATLYRTEHYSYRQGAWQLDSAVVKPKGKLLVSDNEIVIDINGNRTEYKQYIYRRKSISLTEWGGWQLSKNIQLFFDRKTYNTFILKVYEGDRLIKMYFWG